jgi:hypothetical protein
MQWRMVVEPFWHGQPITTQFEKLKLLVLCLSIIHFLHETVQQPPCNQPPFTMINASSGGGGLPPSPERDKEVEPNAKEVADSHN